MEDIYNEAGIEVEADGFITRVETLERINASKAKPMTKCIYPRCEECDKYHGHYCTVPMVISKQIWQETAERIVQMEKRLTELENLVTDEILRSKEVRKMELHNDVNYTWDDYLGETLVTDEILGSDDSRSIKQTDPPNYTWDDYLGEDK